MLAIRPARAVHFTHDSTGAGMAEPLTPTAALPLVTIELLAEPQRDRTEHHDADDFHDVSPASADLARRGD
jgi:hypothetical protein